jgi:hypothetical protein
LVALDRVEQLFCTYLQDEGIGTLYERIVKGRMLRGLAVEHGYRTVLEYGCAVTKGYDNLAFLDQGLSVTLADENIEAFRRGWRFPQHPTYATLDAASPADLVWSFARAQLQPSVIDAIKPLARKHLLIFVPNVFNPGAPIHSTYHLITRTPCRHAERGRPGLRTRAGLVRLMRRHGVRVLASGYIDAPPIPNIAFSLHELKQVMGWLGKNGQDPDHFAPARDPDAVWRNMEALTRFETHPAALPFRPIIAHHIYALGAAA